MSKFQSTFLDHKRNHPKSIYNRRLWNQEQIGEINRMDKRKGRIFQNVLYLRAGDEKGKAG